MSPPILAKLAVLLSLNLLLVQGCPSCDNWRGTAEVICAIDGVTYDSHCELFVALCNQDMITIGDDVDINDLSVQGIVGGYISQKGKCPTDGGGGNCPDCTGVTPSPVCDTSLVEFTSSCELVKELCSLSIVAFDDGMVFTGFSDADYFGYCQSYVGWKGPCAGPCNEGMSSANGNFPCRDCGPGSFQDQKGQTQCFPCARGSYQDQPGSTSCQACPDGLTTVDTGARSISDCKDGCAPGTISASGLEPCQACPAGQYQADAGGVVCVKCMSGSYSPSAGSAACQQCPAGEYSGSPGSAACLQCSAGSASLVAGSHSCDKCGPGTFSEKDSAKECELCKKGSFNDGAENTDCKSCSAGSYADEEGSAKCEQCPVGTFSSADGAETCTPCAEGTYSDTVGAQSCNACPAGHMSDAGASSCTACPAGQHQDNNKCVMCPGNTFSTGGVDTCTPCPSDQISAPGSDKCIACGKGSYINPAGNCEQCPPGLYSDVIGATSCTPCPEGYYSDLMGATSCKMCGAGHFSNSSDATACTMCHPGSFNGKMGAKECELCPEGKYSAQAGSVVCFDCIPGTFSNTTGLFKCHDCDTGSYTDKGGQEVCEECPAGKFNTRPGLQYCMDCQPGMFSDETGSDSCESCPKGSFASMMGASVCDECPKGTYNMYERSPYCTDCPPGTFANSTGNIVCHDCPSGHHNSDSSGDKCHPCPKGTHAEEDGSHHCTNCKAGYFADEEGSAMCQPCEPGSFAYQTGLEKCSDCPAGRFASDNATTSCAACDIGHFSVPGSAVCSPCPTGQYGDKVETASCNYCPVGYFAGVTGLTKCDACAVGEFAETTGSDDCDLCPAGSYADSTGSSSCSLCAAGEYSDQGSGFCKVCPVGTYSDSLGSPSCSKCAAGTYSDSTGASSCSSCAAGSYSPEGSSSCVLCAAGSFSSSAGAAQCDMCSVGSYQDLTGQTACKDCAKGSYGEDDGATSCDLCPSGHYSDTTGQEDCSPCPEGSYSASSGTVSCTLCPMGQVAATNGSVSCTDCPAGSVASKTGMITCVDCAAGSYSGSTGGSDCSQCNAGSYSSKRKSASCTPCDKGSYADDQGETSCTLCPIGTYSDVTGAATCKVCDDSINTDVGQVECEACEKGTRPNSDKSECDAYNIARDKPASQSTTYNSGSDANHGTDGNTNGNYLTGNSCTHTAPQTNPWWKVDLGDTFPVKEVIVYNRKDCCGNRIDGFRVHVGNTGTSSDPVCGDDLKSADFITGVKHIKCSTTGRYISIHHPSTSGGKVLTICELKAYTVDLDRPCPTGFYSATGFRPCKPCRAGSYLDNGSCNICPRGTFSTQDRATSCKDCPAGHTTYKPDTNKCYGPKLEGHYYGNWYARYVQIPDLGQVKDRMNGWVAKVGDWELFDKDYYRSQKGVVKHGQTIPYDNPTVNSIKPIITNKFCYAPRDLGQSYSGYRSTTVSGKSCQNWSSQSPHTHSYGSCPSSHPHVYLNGDYCCKYPREKHYTPAGSTCDGGPISFGSTCCQGDSYKHCPNPPCSGGTVTACLHSYTDFWGADIESFNVVNVEECAMRCKARSGCKSITYHATDKYCWLKRKEFGENGKSDHSSVHSLNIACVKGGSVNSCVRSNTNFWGADIRDMRTKDIEECAGRCMAEPKCKSITFSKRDRNCWLKHKVEGDNGPSDDSTYSSIRADCLIGDDFGSVGNHNYCRNPDNASGGPWCYTTDASTRWEYCDVPKCADDVECYLEEGQTYMGTVSTTEDGQTCDNWPGTSSNICKNTANSGLHKPWCYKSGAKKTCAVDKCDQDCGDPASGLWGRFLAKNSGLCMDVAGSPHSSMGDNVQLHNCEVPHKSATDHVFKMNSDGYIVNERTNYCVNVLGYKSTDPNTNLNMWTCQYNMGTDQKWEVQWSKFDSCAFRLKNKDTHQCIDAPGSSPLPGTNLQQHYCQDDDTSDHWFYFIPTQGWSDTTPGTNLLQFPCEDDAGSDHWFYFIPTKDRMCDYQYYANKYLSGSVPGHGYYSSLASAQQACSRLGAKCGGVTRSGSSGQHSLRTSSTPSVSTSGEKSWVKQDCEDTHFNYFEQQFM